MWYQPRKCEARFEDPITSKQIQWAESKTGYSFPKDYADFLMCHNGLRVRNGTIDIEPEDKIDESDVARVALLYGMRNDGNGAGDLLASQEDYDFADRVPSGFLAIGELMGVARLTLNLGNEGEVMMWDPGIPFEDGPNVQTDQWLSLVAISFTELWNKLAESA